MEKEIESLSNARVYIIGDIILDEYVWSKVDRISPEAPIPIAKMIKKTHILGGAANVAHNISSLGGKAILIGRFGLDKEGTILEKTLREKKIIPGIFIKDKDFPTITKTRIVSGMHQLLRIDREEDIPLKKEDENKILNFLNTIPKNSVVIVSDYNKGIVTEKIATKISLLSKNKKIRTLVDPTPKTIHKIKFPFIVKPNKAAAEILTDRKISDDFDNILDIVRKITAITRAQYTLITLGPQGMVLYGKNTFEKLPAFIRDVFDVSGAGDTTIAVLGAALSCSISLKRSLVLSAVAAGLVVGKIGTAVCTLPELQDFIKHHPIDDYLK